MTTSMVYASELTKSFGKTEVLKGANLEIPAGAVVGLLGTNGAGKSTLIKCLLGLLKPTGGEAKLFGESSWSLSAEAKSRLGHVPQEVRLYPWLTVEQCIRYTAAFYPRWDFALTERLMSEWDLPRDRRVAVISPGQLQKLALILALGHGPELLILDEPVASLDPIARRAFLASLLELIQDSQHTVLFSTHITSDLERVASHVALIKDGKVALFEELDSLKDRVKRLRFQSVVPLPSGFQVPGTLRSCIREQEATITAALPSHDVLDSLRQEFNVTIDVEDLNLEEIFLELHQ